MAAARYAGRRVWRVAAGSGGRDLAEEFLRYGLALVGPPWGDWRADPQAYDSDPAPVRSVAEADPDDLMLLMHGYTIVAVGIIDGDYDYWEGAGYLDGWQLPHRRRVRWANVAELRRNNRPPRYATRSRASAVNKEEVKAWAHVAAAEADRLGLFTRALPALPTDDESLATKACPPCLQAAIKRTQSLWSVIRDDRGWEWPSEAEAVALVVVPLLLDCGLKPKNIALEWHRIDVTVFGGSTRSEDECVLVIETKRPGSGVARGRLQGEAYALKRKLRAPVIATDGFMWSWYQNAEDADPLHAFLPDLKKSAQPFLEALVEHLDPYT